MLVCMHDDTQEQPEPGLSGEQEAAAWRLAREVLAEERGTLYEQQYDLVIQPGARAE